MATRWTMDDIRSRGLQIVGEEPVKSLVQTKPLDPGENYKALGRKKERKMNKTERAYSNLLEMRKQIGEVLWYGYEEINLRLANGCFYKPDFFVLTSHFALEVHEVKGGYWTDDALVKIKAAAEKFPFRFVAKQLIKGEWITREF